MSFEWYLFLLFIFVLLEFLKYYSFARWKKLSEILNIFTFLTGAWLLTDDSFFIVLTGVILLSLAFIADLYRRNKKIDT
ncbi:hypothetical protein [Arsukibacterium sp.]|uniref:hypothetical protein n=1 Tax=Arsukibacterium sp. TaxID=1977258 RepID=UPI002FDA8D1E